MAKEQKKIKTVQDVAAWQLCCGCGACAAVCPDQIEMFDALGYGRRPRFREDADSASAQDAMAVCPGIELTRPPRPEGQLGDQEFYDVWGPVLGVWEGHAADPDIRYEGSSGGAATALALFAMQQLGMQGTLHTRARRDIPYLNETTFSTTKEDLLAAAGSRYSPASPCDGLRQIEQAAGPCVFVGKPCDVAAVNKTMTIRPQLAEKIGLTIAFFCAGTPATTGTLQMLRRMGIEDLKSVISLRYRGRGWPGNAVAEYIDQNGQKRRKELTYDQSWGEVLQKYRQWRCYICPDHIGEYADIAVADAWHRKIEEHQPGRSLIIARTPRGRVIIQQAIDQGAISVQSVSPDIMPLCRPGQASYQAYLWARLKTLALMHVPIPEYRGFDLYALWKSELSWKEKFRSVMSTIKRIYVKKLFLKRTDFLVENAGHRGCAFSEVK